MAKGTTVYVSAKCIPGGSDLNDDLSGWHVCRLYKPTNQTFPCFWDGRNNTLLIGFWDEFIRYKITEDSATEQRTIHDGKWYALELEVKDGKTKINNPDD